MVTFLREQFQEYNYTRVENIVAVITLEENIVAVITKTK